MYRIFFTICCLCFSLAWGLDHCVAGRYGQQASFAVDQLDVSIVVYRNTTDAFDPSVTRALRLGITRPKAEFDQHAAQAGRPVILTAHGGAWLPQFGTADEMYPVAAALSLAGYVTANLEYRTGWDCTEPNLLKVCGVCSSATNNFPRAVYAAVQDVRYAVQFLIDHAQEYGIDPQAIFLGGNSAGSFNVQMGALWSQAEADAFAPEAQSHASLPSLGPLTELPAPGVRGLFDSCGGIFTDPTALTKPPLPVISFHDENDCVSPFIQGQLLNCGPIAPCSRLAQSFGSKKVFNAFGNANANLPRALNWIRISIGHCSWPISNQILRSACFFKRLMCADFTYTEASIAEWFPTSSVPRMNENKNFVDDCFDLGNSQFTPNSTAMFTFPQLTLTGPELPSGTSADSSVATGGHQTNAGGDNSTTTGGEPDSGASSLLVPSMLSAIIALAFL